MKTAKPILSAMDLQFFLIDQIAALSRVDDLAFVFEMAASGVRLRLLLLLLANNELRIGDLSAITGLLPIEVADHLAHLARAELVQHGTPDDDSIYRPGNHALVGWLRTHLEDEQESLRR